MRWLYLLFVLLLVGAIAIFALQNQEPIMLQYFNQNISCTPALLVAVVYVLGMVSGWTVVSLVQRSLRQVTEPSSR